MLTVQKRYREPEFKEGEYLEIRLRAKMLGGFKAGDKVKVVTDTRGNLVLKRSSK